MLTATIADQRRTNDDDGTAATRPQRPGNLGLPYCYHHDQRSHRNLFMQRSFNPVGSPPLATPAGDTMTTPQYVHPSNRRLGDSPACPPHCPLARLRNENSETESDTSGMTRFCALRSQLP